MVCLPDQSMVLFGFVFHAFDIIGSNSGWKEGRERGRERGREEERKEEN